VEEDLGDIQQEPHQEPHQDSHTAAVLVVRTGVVLAGPLKPPIGIRSLGEP
jgi:hypothetical protein